MIRVIVREVETLMPHGEPVIHHRTIDIDAPELEQVLLQYRTRMVTAAVIGAEVIEKAREMEGK